MHNDAGLHIIECFGYGGGVAEVEGDDGGGGGAREACAGYGPGLAVECCCDGAAEEAAGACYEGCLGGHRDGCCGWVGKVGMGSRLRWRGYMGEAGGMG